MAGFGGTVYPGDRCTGKGGNAPEGAKFYSDGQVVSVADIYFAVMETPGHTPGSVCLMCTQEGEVPNTVASFLSIVRTMRFAMSEAESHFA